MSGAQRALTGSSATVARMNRVWLIAVREFVATVMTKAFIIGLLIFPAILAIMAVVGPRLFGDMDFSVEGSSR